MCDQSEVPYRPGNVVWVKLGPVWWPGVVADDEEIPPEILKTLRKTPIAIVKFFQEKEFEYVHKLSNIYHYNCLKKNDFIRKGLDLYRSKNRDAHSNMKLFPEDVARAEVLTGGNPNILNDEMFKPEEKPTYSDFFAKTKKSPKKIKPDSKKKSLIQGESQQPSAPRIITHPRFIKLSSGMETDYEVRERKQVPIRAECDEEDNSPPTTYRCQDCDFTTIRLNVIVLHNKLHTRNYHQPTPSKVTTKRKNISVVRVKERPFSNESKLSQPAEAVKPKTETNGSVQKTGKRGRPRKVVPGPSPIVSSKITTKAKELEPKKSSRTSVAETSRDASQKDEFQESLLEDWAEFETDHDNVENGGISTRSSIDTQETSCEMKPVDENHSINKKDEFDFDESEEQLFIDKSKIRAGRKIPRVLEDKSDELKDKDTASGKKRRISETHANIEETKTEILEGKKKSNKSENVKKRRLSGTTRNSEGMKIENQGQSSELGDQKVTKKSRTRRTLREEKTKLNSEVENDNKNENVEAKYQIHKIENMQVDRTEDIQENITLLARAEETREEVEVENEIEIEIEQTVDDDYESSRTVETPPSPVKKPENNDKEEESMELSQKVDQLLQEVAVPSTLPELPRSLKKEHIKSYNASLTKRSIYDDEIIESISLINDDSSDSFEEKNCTTNDQKTTQANEKNHTINDISSSAIETSVVDNIIENIEVTSDSSPEIVSVEMPSRVGSAIVKKTPMLVGATTTAGIIAKRTPVRFTVTPKLKSIHSNQVTKKTTNQVNVGGVAKMLRVPQPQSSRLTQQPRHQLQELSASKSRSVFRQNKPADGRTTVNVTNPKMNEFFLLKQVSRPSTIANIDLTGSKNRFVPSIVTKPVRPISGISSKSSRNVATLNKVPQSKSLVLGSTASVHKTISPAIKFVSSSDSSLIPVQAQSEIITVSDDIECPHSNEPTEEMNYIVDEAGNVIAENACTSSKKEDILAKALQDTDVLQSEITLANSSTLVLEPCNIVQNSLSTTVYENVTLNTPPIMSSFETPSRTMNPNLSEISEYIIISDAADNIQ